MIFLLFGSHLGITLGSTLFCDVITNYSSFSQILCMCHCLAWIKPLLKIWKGLGHVTSCSHYHTFSRKCTTYFNLLPQAHSLSSRNSLFEAHWQDLDNKLTLLQPSWPPGGHKVLVNLIQFRMELNSQHWRS